jgi:SAM-dependent methyltransferase
MAGSCIKGATAITTSLDPTIVWYERNAEAFAADTVGVAMDHLRRPFLDRLPAPARILDAGCGAGRDAAAFTRLGHQVVAMEPCEALAARAEALLGATVLRQRFDQMTFAAEFDGVWACASLLHVPASELTNTLDRCSRALRVGGILFASFKYGRGERRRDGRWFTDLDERGWAEHTPELEDLHTIDTWTTSDARPNRTDERWLNVLVQRRDPKLRSGPADCGKIV